MRDAYTSTRTLADHPRIPLKGSIDLTYRCNNRCRHCWLWTDKGEGELTKEEIFDIVDQARAMGCREWAISGGEPMLRPDFPEIFDYITSRCRTYSLNTNGTLITPEIAELMKRKGSKMVALYGATAEVHDHITRNPGSFEATMRGIQLLKEAGAGFIVQIVPMQDNYHQLEEMKALAESLSPHWRIGAAWLFLSASHDPVRNSEIAAQRLPPRVVVDLDRPEISSAITEEDTGHPQCPTSDDRLYAACIATRREFHVDPYSRLSFCSFIKDPMMRYDLRTGTFREGWDAFIPSLAHRVEGGREYLEGCGSCNEREDCRWCPVYGYLEHGRHTAPVEYLCTMAHQTRSLREQALTKNRRFFQIGGITIQVTSDIPFTDTSFSPRFDSFFTDIPGPDTVRIHHHFGIPDLDEKDLGQEVFRRVPWAIFRKGNSWIYAGISSDENKKTLEKLAVFSLDHTIGTIYNETKSPFLSGNISSITLFTTDQILLARLLADRDGFIVHSCGVVMGDRGFLFVGHSEAGKTTMARMLAPHAKILCDDRNIVRRYKDGWQVSGTWSHGDCPEVSSRSTTLRAVFFLEQDSTNRITLISERKEIIQRLFATVIRPFVTADWWDKTLTSIEQLARDVPCYRMQFDRSGKIIDELKHL